MQKNAEKPKQKEYFTVELDAMVPATLRFKVLAESPEEALKVFLREGNLMEKPHIKTIHKMKKIYARVYNFGTNLLRTGIPY